MVDESTSPEDKGAFQIREATLQDVNTLLDIQKSDGYAHSYYLSQERVKNILDKKQVFYLASIDGNPAGFTCVDFDVRTWIHFFSVKEQFQGKGVSDNLMRKVIEESKKRGIDLLYVVVGKDSNKMQSFLTEKGFTKSGEHLDRFGPGKDGLIFNLNLISNSNS